MCGIAGFIGESKNPQLTYEITTKLFAATESRGIDASGFWGSNSQNQVIYHKEPFCASKLIEKDIWKKVNKFNPNLLLIHARQASVGNPIHNKNNHPFVNNNRTLCLVHNGRIPEFDILKRQYQVLSNCDSEILLRVIENATDRLTGIKEIFSLINSGHMAVALGEVNKQLYLFRNHHRSLWVIDVREILGQIFFCSTSEIWQEATSNRFNKQKLIELPTEEIWHFSDLNLNKYKVQRGVGGQKFVLGKQIPLCIKESNVSVISKLNEHDEDIKKNGIYSQMKKLIDDIETEYLNLSAENSLSEQDLQDLDNYLIHIKDELTQTLRTLTIT